MTVDRETEAEFFAELLSAPPNPQLALIFPGQGSQKPGMGRDVSERFGPAQQLFQVADRVLGWDVSSFCFEATDEALTHTAQAQPAILTASLAYLVAALETGTITARPAFLAGHSLGEFTALVAARSLGLEEALRLVSERALLMAKAGDRKPGAMAAVLGLAEDDVSAICHTTGAEPANYNQETQVVIGGTPEAIDQAAARARERGAKILPIKVSGAFHTSLMGDAAAEFARMVDVATISDPMIPVIGNVSGLPLASADDVRAELKAQIISPVRWRQTIDHMLAHGVQEFLEVGPGRVLTAMLKRTAPHVSAVAIGSVDALSTASHV